MTDLSRSIRILAILILSTTMLLAAGGCYPYFLQNLDTSGSTPDPEPGTGAEIILCTEEQATLAWDPPPSETAIYKLYYRIHGSGSWILFDEIPAEDHPQYTLYHAEFGNGDFDFGVVAVNGEAAESEMHTSLDDTALPESGWYLSWVR